MKDLERVEIRLALMQLKARYFRGVDTGDGALVRSILAEDCVLDYTNCFVDPTSGQDYLPSMSKVIRGRSGFPTEGSLKAAGIVTVHQGHNVEYEITGPTTASGVWSMTDRLFMPPGGPYGVITGYGHYHETYEKTDGAWGIKTLLLTRLRVDAA
jgi:hypothetical protein